MKRFLSLILALIVVLSPEWALFAFADENEIVSAVPVDYPLEMDSDYKNRCIEWPEPPKKVEITFADGSKVITSQREIETESGVLPIEKTIDYINKDYFCRITIGDETLFYSEIKKNQVSFFRNLYIFLTDVLIDINYIVDDCFYVFNKYYTRDEVEYELNMDIDTLKDDVSSFFHYIFN